MKATVKERLIEYLRYKGIGQNKFEKMTGLSNGYISNLKRSPSADKLNIILAKNPDLNENWLLTGEGEMLKTGEGEMMKGEACPPEVERGDDCSPFIIPLIPAVAMAGALPDVSDPVFRSQCRRVQAPVAGCDFAIQISGDSMLPDFKSGDFLAVSRITDPRMLPYSVPLLIDTREGALLKCLEPCDRDNLTAVSLNPAYRPYTVPKDIILAVYRVRAVFRIINTL